MMLTTQKTIALISSLHEDASDHSAIRQFRNQPVLAWTLQRLSAVKSLQHTIIICRDDQAGAVSTITQNANVSLDVHPTAALTPSMQTVNAALRWSDGWRGGLYGACHFDRGFNGAIALRLMNQHNADQALLIDPAMALLDPALNQQLIDHANQFENIELFFTQAAPGWAGVILRKSLIERLAKAQTHPGRLLSYWPDLLGRDPITTDACLAVSPKLTRTRERFTFDSNRQVERLGKAAASLNGQLISSDAATISDLLSSHRAENPMPREVTLELCAHRSTKPIFAATSHLQINRADMSLDHAKKTLDQLAGIDDIRLTFGGAGDPILHPDFAAILSHAKSAGIRAIHIETDLLDAPDAAMQSLNGIDMVSIILPAVTPAMYHTMMGIDCLQRVLQNITQLVRNRISLPIVIPTFIKCRENIAEMEPWYDHWLRTLQVAVIRGPSDHCGLTPDHACADMSPPIRRPCARIQNRLTILSDGDIVSCEEDVTGRSVMGNIANQSIAQIWQNQFAALRQLHVLGNWNNTTICGNCREWHRP